MGKSKKLIVAYAREQYIQGILLLIALQGSFMMACVLQQDCMYTAWPRPDQTYLFLLSVKVSGRMSNTDWEHLVKGRRKKRTSSGDCFSKSPICKTCFGPLKPHNATYEWLGENEPLDEQCFWWKPKSLGFWRRQTQILGQKKKNWQMHSGPNSALLMQESLMDSKWARETAPDSFTVWHGPAKPSCVMHTVPHLADPAPSATGTLLSSSTF